MFDRIFFAIVVLFSFGLVSFAQTGTIDNVAGQAAAVSEFEVNGLKVILKRRASTATVSTGLFIRGGARNITEKNAGIEHLMLLSALEAGKKYSRQAVRRAQAGTGSSIGAGVSQDYSVLSMASTRQNFDRMWDIYTDLILDPAFAPEDVERMRQQMLTWLREETTNPDAALDALEDKVVYSGHTYANSVRGTIPTVSAFSPADLREFHRKVMTTSQLLLVVVGNIDEANLRAKVAATLAKLPRGSYKDAPFAPLDFSKPTLDVTPRTLQTNYIRGVFPAPAMTSPDYHAMQVAVNILLHRVMAEVRGRRQLSYAPSAEMHNYAMNTANIYVTATEANEAVRAMLNEIKGLQESKVPSEMITAIMGEFLTQYYLRQETNAAQVGELGRWELIGGGWRNSFEFLNKARAVTPEQIQAVAAKYMKNLRFVVVGTPAAIDRSIFLQGRG
jgi:zinc protease